MTALEIVLAAIGFGAGAEALRRYRYFKRRRFLAGPEIRNSGFWTDRKVYLAEFAVITALLAVPFSVIVLLLGATDQPVLHVYAALLVFAAAILLLMRGANLTGR